MPPIPPDHWHDYFSLLMEFEGTTFEHDPNDPGGATKYGIDQRSHPGVNIRALTRAGAEQIYLSEYAASPSAHFPFPLNYAFFDFAVNAGQLPAAKALQAAVHTRVDGKVGPITQAAVQAKVSSGQMPHLLARFHTAREIFYTGLSATRPRKFGRYLNGWLRRTRAMSTWASTRITP